jgi:hypothetical protein
MTAMTAPKAPPGTSDSTISTRCSPPRPRNTSENTDTPSTIAKTRALITAVLRMTASSVPKEKARLKAARIIEPTAPIEAASVGVAKPARIEPSTATISSSGGISARTKRRPSEARCASSITRAGQSLGRANARPMM